MKDQEPERPPEGATPFIRYPTAMAHSRPHTLLRRTAKEMAGVFYDGNRSAAFRALFPSQRLYVREHWPEFVKQARDTLLEMLNSPTTSEHFKRAIYDAVTGDFEEKTKHAVKGIRP